MSDTTESLSNRAASQPTLPALSGSGPRSRPEGMVPWPVKPLPEDPLDGAAVHGLMVFVPAIMSVGVLFSLATLLRDAFHWTGGQARDHRTAIKAGGVVSAVLGEQKPDLVDLGVRPRMSYLLSALVMGVGLLAIVIGSLTNFANGEGPARESGWILAVSLSLALIPAVLGGASLALFRHWPHPPAWTSGLIQNTPLVATPGHSGQGPSSSLTLWTLGAGVVTAVISLLVAMSPDLAMEIDEPVARWLVEAKFLDQLSAFDLLGATMFSIAFVALIGLSAFRCRVMALTYPLAFGVSWLGGAAIRTSVDRPRPHGLGQYDSFPSGHIVQAVFIAGLVPLALRVIHSDRKRVVLVRSALILAVVVTVMHRLHRQDHWPLDALAGVTLGLTVVFATHWIMEHRIWHRNCATCPWSAHNPGL